MADPTVPVGTPNEAEVDAEIERILTMSDAEIEAEARARGEDPEEARRWGLAIFQAAMEDVANGKR